MEDKIDKLVSAIRRAADNISAGDGYEWGHMGRCNCGHLARELTSLSAADIQRYAMEKSGDWADQVLDFCPTSGMTMDWLISELSSYGLSHRDLIDLERLSNAEVLESAGSIELSKNNAAHVAHYMNTWAGILEKESC